MYSLGSSRQTAQKSTTWVPCVLMILKLWPASSRYPAPLRASTVCLLTSHFSRLRCPHAPECPGARVILSAGRVGLEAHQLVGCVDRDPERCQDHSLAPRAASHAQTGARTEPGACRQLQRCHERAVQ